MRSGVRVDDFRIFAFGGSSSRTADDLFHLAPRFGTPIAPLNWLMPGSGLIAFPISPGLRDFLHHVLKSSSENCRTPFSLRAISRQLSSTKSVSLASGRGRCRPSANAARHALGAERFNASIVRGTDEFDRDAGHLSDRI